MRKMFAAMTAAALVLALSAPAFAKTETVQGQIVDLGCYKMDKANAAVDHKMPKGDTKDCAIGCAKAGKPMAILTKDGKVYQLAGGKCRDMCFRRQRCRFREVPRHPLRQGRQRPDQGGSHGRRQGPDRRAVSGRLDG